MQEKTTQDVQRHIAAFYIAILSNDSEAAKEHEISICSLMAQVSENDLEQIKKMLK